MATVFPIMQLYVSGKFKNQWSVTAADTNYTTNVVLTGSDQIDMVFTNDAYAPPEDRNLYVNYIVVAGRTIQAESGAALVDGGLGSAAFVGQSLGTGYLSGSYNLYAHSTLPDSSWTGSIAELKINRYSGRFEKSLYGSTYYPNFTLSDSLDPMSYQAYLMVLNPDDRVLYSEVLPFAMNSGVDLNKDFPLTRTTPPTVEEVLPLPYTKHGEETITTEDYTTTETIGSYYVEGGRYNCTCSCKHKIKYGVPTEYTAVSAHAPAPGQVIDATTIAYNQYSEEAGALYPNNNFVIQGPPTPIPGIIINRSYYYAGGQRIAMRVEGEYDPSRDGVYFLLGDHLGSTSVTVDANGNRVAELRYDPWGKTRFSSGTTPTTFHYTGQREEKGLGLYFYGARWYDAGLSRFISPDSVIPDPLNSLDWDRYAYVRNNPLRYSDPTGHFPWPLLLFAVWAALNVPGDSGPYQSTLINDALGDIPLRMASNPYDLFRTGVDCFRGDCSPLDVIFAMAPLVPGGISKLEDAFEITNKFKNIKGIETLTAKLLSKSEQTVKGAMGELNYLIQHQDEVEEVGRVCDVIHGGEKEIDFVLKGNIFVNVKNYDWSKYTPFTLKMAIQRMIREASDFMVYNPSEIQYVFVGIVPDEVRKALEAAGITVKVLP